jgi:hypothetical protein
MRMRTTALEKFPPEGLIGSGGDVFWVGVGRQQGPLGKDPGGRDAPILLAIISVNQKAPSGPLVIPTGSELDVGIMYSVNLPRTTALAGLLRPLATEVVPVS